MFFSHEQQIYTTTSLGENSIEFELQTDGNMYVVLRQTYLPLNIKLFKWRGSDTYKRTEKKKEHKEDNVFTETGDDYVDIIDEEHKGVPHFTQVNNILHSIFYIADWYINNHQTYNSNGLHAQKSHICSICKSILTDFKELLNCEGL